MSVVLSGPRRVYVMLLFWQQLTGRCLACPRPLAAAERAIGGDRPEQVGYRCSPGCRLIFTLRLQRVFWSRLVGVSLMVLDPGRE